MILCVKSFNLALAEACLSRRELAAKSGVSDSTICKGVNKRADLKPKTVGKIANALGVSVLEIIEHKDMSCST